MSFFNIANINLTHGNINTNQQNDTNTSKQINSNSNQKGTTAQCFNHNTTNLSNEMVENEQSNHTSSSEHARQGQQNVGNIDQDELDNKQEYKNNNNEGNGGSEHENNTIIKSYPFGFKKFCTEIPSIVEYYDHLEQLEPGGHALVTVYDKNNKYCQHLRATLDIVAMNHPEIPMMALEMGRAGFLLETYDIIIKPTTFLMDKTGNMSNRQNGMDWIMSFRDYYEYNADYLEDRMFYVGYLTRNEKESMDANTFYLQQNQCKNQLLMNEDNTINFGSDNDYNNNDDDEDSVMDID